MMVDTRVDTLLKVPLFSRLSARQVRRILKSASEDHYKEGATDVRERGPGNTLFVIMEAPPEWCTKDAPSRSARERTRTPG